MGYLNIIIFGIGLILGVLAGYDYCEYKHKKYHKQN